VHPFRFVLANSHYRTPALSNFLVIAPTIPFTWLCSRSFFEFHLEHLYASIYASRQKVIVVVKVVWEQGGKVGEPIMLNWKIGMPTAGRSDNFLTLLTIYIIIAFQADQLANRFQGYAPLLFQSDLCVLLRGQGSAPQLALVCPLNILVM